MNELKVTLQEWLSELEDEKQDLRSDIISSSNKGLGNTFGVGHETGEMFKLDQVIEKLNEILSTIP